ncbi:MAG: HPr-rel-A system PqqD family peptide chaperone [Thiobacillus sp.]|nr:HPr-rel-A system PqqD family peptide chaperone [Thiobacillus sp.]
MAHVSAPLPRLLKSWGNEAVIYDTASGDTHYLKPLTLALYQTCRANPGATSAELANALATQLGFADIPELLELTEDTLQHLRKINLLETA